MEDADDGFEAPSEGEVVVTRADEEAIASGEIVGEAVGRLCRVQAPRVRLFGAGAVGAGAEVRAVRPAAFELQLIQTGHVLDVGHAELGEQDDLVSTHPVAAREDANAGEIELVLLLALVAADALSCGNFLTAIAGLQEIRDRVACARHIGNE